MGERLLWTAQHSKTYGGKWDTWAREYTDEADDVLYIPVTADQFDFVESDEEVVEGAGGRGSGKSDGGVRKVARNVCERPMEWGRIVVPGPDQRRENWHKAISFFLEETDWLLPGLQGIQTGLGELWFQNGVRVQFISAHKPDKLRSWGGSWASVDEAQAVTTEALDVLWPCLRDGGDRPQMWMQLTPEVGEPYERHKLYLKDPDAKTIAFDSFTNCFVSHKTFHSSKARMSATKAAIEIGASWEVVAELARAGELRKVFNCFSRDKHRWRPVEQDLGADITRRVVERKVGKLRGHNWNYIAGVDPNKSVPNMCTIWKVFAPRRRGEQERWVAWDFIFDNGHCGRLAHTIWKAGYPPSQTIIVPDFSSRYNKLGSRKASSALMREVGYHVINRPKNPPVVDSVEDMLAKLDPAAGPPSMFFRLPQCDMLCDNMEKVLWHQSDKGFNKEPRPDPVDSARYPVSFFAPAAQIVNRGVRGFMIK